MRKLISKINEIRRKKIAVFKTLQYTRIWPSDNGWL